MKQIRALLFSVWCILASITSLTAQNAGSNSPLSAATTLSEDGARDVARAQFPNGRVLKSTLNTGGGTSVWSVQVEEDKISGGSKRPKIKKETWVVEIDALNQKVLSKKKSSAATAH